MFGLYNVQIIQLEPTKPSNEEREHRGTTGITANKIKQEKACPKLSIRSPAQKSQLRRKIRTAAPDATKKHPTNTAE